MYVYTGQVTKVGWFSYLVCYHLMSRFYIEMLEVSSYWFIEYADGENWKANVNPWTGFSYGHFNNEIADKNGDMNKVNRA